MAPIDVCQRVYAHLSGLALNCDSENGTFTLDIDNWVSSLKDAKDPTSKPLKPIAPIFCTIPNSPKYKTGRPVPYNRRFVSVSGFLTSADFRNNQREDGISRFHITVDHIVFLGQPPSALAGNTFPNTLDCKWQPSFSFYYVWVTDFLLH